MTNIIVVLVMISGIIHGLIKLSESNHSTVRYDNLFNFLFDIKQK
jgi:hypothetical protein